LGAGFGAMGHLGKGLCLVLVWRIV
jgi:hypothetical protein